MVGREEQSWAGCLSLCEKSQRHLSLPSPLPGLDEGYSAQLGTARGLRWLEAERGPFGRVMQTHPSAGVSTKDSSPPSRARSLGPSSDQAGKEPGARPARLSVCTCTHVLCMCACDHVRRECMCACVRRVFSCAHRHTMCVGTTHDWWVCVCVLATCRKVRWPGEGALGSRPHHVSRTRVTSKGPVLG